MGKYYCDYCDIYLWVYMLKGAGSLFRTLHSPVLHKIHSSGYLLTYRTHDSMSARKAHNTGRNHISNVRDYFANLGRDGHTVIDSIVNGDAGGGRVQMFAAPSMRLGAGFMNPIASAPGGFTGVMPQGAPPSFPPRPPFPPQAGAGGPPPFAGAPPPFPPPGGAGGLPFPPRAGAPPPTFQPQQGPPPQGNPGVHPDRIRMMGQ